MIEIGKPWRYANEGDAIHFVVTTEEGQRRIKLKRSENAALFDALAPEASTPPPENG